DHSRSDWQLLVLVGRVNLGDVTQRFAAQPPRFSAVGCSGWLAGLSRLVPSGLNHFPASRSFAEPYFGPARNQLLPHGSFTPAARIISSPSPQGRSEGSIREVAPT